nr:toll/interleukin-1 receptor domain-containing protein [Pseudofrankia inefficax]
MAEGVAPESRWHFFVSYTGRDQAWAEWVAWQLETAGYRVLIQVWDFVPGSHWQTQMEEGILGAERTVAILSDAYLTSVYGRAEWQAVYRADPQGFARRLIPIRVEDCARPGLLGEVVSLDLFNHHADAARSHLLDMIAYAIVGRAKPSSAPNFPGHTPPPPELVAPRQIPPGESPTFPGLTTATNDAPSTSETAEAPARGGDSPMPTQTSSERSARPRPRPGWIVFACVAVALVGAAPFIVPRAITLVAGSTGRTSLTPTPRTFLTSPSGVPATYTSAQVESTVGRGTQPTTLPPQQRTHPATSSSRPPSVYNDPAVTDVSQPFPADQRRTLARLAYDLRGLGCSVPNPEPPTSKCVVSANSSINNATMYTFTNNTELNDFMVGESHRLQRDGNTLIHLISNPHGIWAIETDGLVGNQLYDVLNVNDPAAGAAWAYP